MEVAREKGQGGKKMKTVITLRHPEWNRNQRMYVYLYQNKRNWVTRLHPETATGFSSAEEARAIVTKFNLDRHDAIIESIYC